MQYVLVSRQRSLYVHRTDIWATEIVINADKSQGPSVLALKYSDVPCYYEFTPNVDDPITAVGDAKRMTMDTTDVIHLPLYYLTDTGKKCQIVIPDGAKFVNRTPPMFSQQNRGQFHNGLGIPRIIPGTRQRTTNKQEVEAMIAEHPPQPIADFYGWLQGDESK